MLNNEKVVQQKCDKQVVLTTTNKNNGSHKKVSCLRDAPKQIKWAHEVFASQVLHAICVREIFGALMGNKDDFQKQTHAKTLISISTCRWFKWLHPGGIFNLLKWRNENQQFFKTSFNSCTGFTFPLLLAPLCFELPWKYAYDPSAILPLTSVLHKSLKSTGFFAICSYISYIWSWSDVNRNDLFAMPIFSKSRISLKLQFFSQLNERWLNWRKQQYFRNLLKVRLSCYLLL